MNAFATGFKFPAQVDDDNEYDEDDDDEEIDIDNDGEDDDKQRMISHYGQNENYPSKVKQLHKAMTMELYPASETNSPKKNNDLLSPYN